MYKNNSYKCDICAKTIKVNSPCWINIRFPEKRMLAGYQDVRETIKQSNSSIICEECSHKISTKITMQSLRKIVEIFDQE